MMDRLIDENLPSLRWLAAGVAGLGIDLMLFAAGLDVGLAPVSAAVIGHVGGLFVQWFLSVHADVGAEIGREPNGLALQSGFFLSAVGGIVLTAAIMGVGARIGLHPLPAKMAAIALVLQTSFLVRRRIATAS